jgi:cytochrome c oxidase subunit 1
LLPVIYLVWSLRYGKIAGPNPWQACGLEWQTSSPPPVHNFVSPPSLPPKPYDYQTEAEDE